MLSNISLSIKLRNTIIWCYINLKLLYINMNVFIFYAFVFVYNFQHKINKQNIMNMLITLTQNKTMLQKNIIHKNISCIIIICININIIIQFLYIYV